MIRFLSAILIPVLCLACGKPSNEDGVESRLRRCLGVSELPPSLRVGASTIDSDDGWACYQIEFNLAESAFGNLLRAHPYEHVTFDISRSPNFQEIKLGSPFQAVGVYERRIDNHGSCKLFHEATPGRYFLLYLYEPPRQ